MFRVWEKRIPPTSNEALPDKNGLGCQKSAEVEGQRRRFTCVKRVIVETPSMPFITLEKLLYIITYMNPFQSLGYSLNSQGTWQRLLERLLKNGACPGSEILVPEHISAWDLGTVHPEL